MEKKTILIVAVTALIAFSAGAGAVLIQQPKIVKDDDTTSHDMSSMSMSSNMNEMSNNLTGLKDDAFDKEFLSEMITHHEGAVDMAKLALTNAKHQEVKSMAQDIISAQTKEIGEMKIWQKDWGY